RVAIQRKNMRDILIRPHDDHTPRFPIDATHREGVVTAFEIEAEHLFVVAKSVTSLPREKQRRQGLDGELEMTLLEHSTDIDHRIDIIAGRGIPSDGRLPIPGEEIAQGTDGGAGRCGILRTRKGEDPKAAIRLDDVAEVNGPGIRQPN